MELLEIVSDDEVEQMSRVRESDIIMVDGYDDEWDGCLMFVDEVCDGYILAGMHVPYKGVTFLRLKDDEYFSVTRR